MHVSQKARSICARRHHVQWWRHAGDAGAREGVRPVLARRSHAYFRPTVHERDAQALCPETPKRQCRPVVEAGVVGRSDPPLRAVEERYTILIILVLVIATGCIYISLKTISFEVI
jgi:hypothetical protein